MLSRKVPIKIVRVKLARDVKHFSVWHLLTFGLIFAIIGGYIIYHGFGLTPLETPTNLTQTAQPDGTVNLSWTAPNGPDVTSYKIYQYVPPDPTSGDSSTVTSSSAYIGTTTETSYQVTGLEAGSAYDFYVVAVDSAGAESAPSNQVLATTTANLDTLALATTTTNIDYKSQSAVNDAYWKLWAPAQTTKPDWTGSVKYCKPGIMSDTARHREVNAINFARRLQQLKPIGGGNPTANSNDMKAALLMQANGMLSHEPTPTDFPKCWKQAGATGGATSAGQSLLSLGPDTVGGHIAGFMDDLGSGNTFVGHRRWLSLPEADTFGIGTTSSAAGVQVINMPISASNPSPNVMWPMKGYFPSTLAPGYSNCQPTAYQGCSEIGVWSYSGSSQNISFPSSTVSVTHNGTAVTVKKYTSVDGYGRNTLTWSLPKNYDTSGDYTVTINKIKHTASSGKVTYSSTSYTVHFFDPVQS